MIHTFAEGEGELFSSVPAGVKLGAIRLQGAHIVNKHLVTRQWAFLSLTGFQDLSMKNGKSNKQFWT